MKGKVLLVVDRPEIAFMRKAFADVDDVIAVAPGEALAGAAAHTIVFSLALRIHINGLAAAEPHTNMSRELEHYVAWFRESLWCRLLPDGAFLNLPSAFAEAMG